MVCHYLAAKNVTSLQEAAVLWIMWEVAMLSAIASVFTAAASSGATKWPNRIVPTCGNRTQMSVRALVVDFYYGDADDPTQRAQHILEYWKHRLNNADGQLTE